MSKKFYAQLHMHTAETSKCGRSGAADMIRACKDAGYSLVAVTDHFFNGNIGCKPAPGEKPLPWEQQVEYLFRGYHAAKAEGDRIGVEVLQAWETYTKGPELLTYGLGEDFLLANPDIVELDYYAYIKRVTDAGGLIIHAHPYRRMPYLIPFTPDPNSLEAYEVYNHSDTPNNPHFNHQARAEAEAHNLLMFAGSDAHTTDGVRGGAMCFDDSVHSMSEIFQAMREGRGRIVEYME